MKPTVKTKRGKVVKAWKYKGDAYIRPIGRGITLGKPGYSAAGRIGDLADILEEKFGSVDVHMEIAVSPLTPSQRTKKRT